MLTPNELKSLRREAYGRLGCGESEDDVRAWLLSQKVKHHDCEEILAECQAELQTERNGFGLRYAILAGGSFALSAVILGTTYFVLHLLKEMVKGEKIFGYAFAIAGLLATAGAFFLIRSIDYFTGSGPLKQ